MRKLFFIILIGIIYGCDSAEAPDCLKSAGGNITNSIPLDSFNELIINNDFNVILTQGVEQSVTLTIGENIFNDISFEVINNILEVKNNVGCKWVRKYDYPTIEITHPNLELIEIVGGSLVTTTNVLTYPNLLLKAKDSNGVFTLNVNSDNLTIDSNEITNYYLNGITTNLNIQLTSGDGRIEAGLLTTTNANISHASSNDIIVNVTNELNVTINSTGNVIYVGQEPTSINTVIQERGSVINGVN